MRRVGLVGAALCLSAMLSACGEGNNNNNTPMVTVSPATANVAEGSILQFSDTVINSSNTAVTWAVNGIAGGNATAGTISSTGLYTAPAIIPSPPSVTVTATLQANTGVSGNAVVTITAVTFNNASLKGNYIFSLTGIDANGFTFCVVGAVTADGNGNTPAARKT
jgi:hypothetical protein